MLAGAVAVQAGTAFLRCPESGAPQRHKDALADPAFGATTVTRAFSGRRARALVNSMVRAHPDAPAAYPEINNATRPLRTAAAGGRCRADVAVGGTGLPAGGRTACWRDRRAAVRVAGIMAVVRLKLTGTWEKGGAPVKAARFDEYGEVDVLEAVDAPSRAGTGAGARPGQGGRDQPG